MTLDPAGPVARRFPLVARSRPACIPLDTRVGELCTLAACAAVLVFPGEKQPVHLGAG
jgi:hypothetical protein